MTTSGITPADASQPRRRVLLLASLAHWNDARLTRHVLRRLSRRELGDIGIDDPETLIRR